MFCSKCGKEIDDGAKFCLHCGAPVGGEPTADPVENAPETAPVSPVEVTPKKKNTGKWIGIGAIVVCVLAAAALLFNLSALRNTAAKVLKSDEDYLVYVLDRDVKEATKTTGAIVEAVKTATDKTQTMKGTLEVEFGDSAKSLFTMLASGSGLDFDWLDNVSFEIEESVSGKQMQADIALLLNGKEVTDFSFLQEENGDSYFCLPQLNDSYLRIPTNAETAGYLQEIYAALPDQKTLVRVLNRYTDLILDSVESAEKTKETLSHAGVSQTCTAYTVDVDLTLVQKLLVNVLNTVKTDKDIRGIVADFCETELLAEYDADEVWASFTSEIEYALEDFNDYDPETDNEHLATFVFYVDGDGEVIGFRIYAEDFDMHLYSVRDGKSSAVSFKCDVDGETVALEGSGTTKRGVYTGTFKLSADGMQILDIDVDRFDVDAAAKGKTDFKCTLSLSSTAKAMLSFLGTNQETAALAMFANYSFVFEAKGNATTASVSFSIMDGDKLFASLSEKMTVKNGGKFKGLPSGAPVVDVTNDAEMNAYLSGLDIYKLAENLKEAGMPNVLTNEILDEFR